jgi:hypothetical protein
MHSKVSLLNPWELLRKFVCADCGAVVTCACGRDIATYVLPHQATHGVDPSTNERVPVTEQLVPGVCFDCRGVVPDPYPKSAQRGARSVVHRFYWHELWTGTQRARLDWCRRRGLPLLGERGQPMLPAYARQFPAEFKHLSTEVLARVREEHEASPRYDVSRPSDAEVLEANGVSVVGVRACYVETERGGRVHVADLGTTDLLDAVGVEDFVAGRLRSEGRDVMFLESRPVQCMFGALMWLWVQDPEDGRCRAVFFGGRDGVGADEQGRIGCMLPEDFGSAGHAHRRAAALDGHMSWLPDDIEELLGLYDYWLEPSRPLRQYLWAYTSDVEERARNLIRVLGSSWTRKTLRFLAEDYWGRYCGWPDLLAWHPAPTGPEDFELIEVKSSNDRLTDDQRRWITDNSAILQLPFHIVKVHRTEGLREQRPAQTK